ncbi:MAG: homoserine dehydrogenase [Pseudomonadota bacterium]
MSEDQQVNVGICGLGTVGGGTYRLLQGSAALLAARSGISLVVTHVGARRDNAECDTGDVKVSRDIFAVVQDPDVQILVELIGGTTVARELTESALRAGKHVVTANKALIAEHGMELLSLAAEQGVSLRYEAAVAGGIPIIKAIREGLAANRIEWLAGIINGTGNFILTEMRDRGRSFGEVLQEAQALGYAEADPTFDVEGIDAAHKLVILASLAFGMPLQMDAVYTEGITQLTPADLDYAAQLGYRIKHLGLARQSPAGVELRVHPTLIPEKRLLANVDGVKNAVLVEGDAVGPTLYYGAGAGAGPTASAVVADLVDLARDLRVGQVNQVPGLGFLPPTIREIPIIPMDDVETAWYLRMEAEDKPGVMSEVTRLLGERGISIEGLIQKAPQDGATKVTVIVLTNSAAQAKVEAAVGAIDALDSIHGAIARIRVETLDG